MASIADKYTWRLNLWVIPAEWGPYKVITLTLHISVSSHGGKRDFTLPLLEGPVIVLSLGDLMSLIIF